MRSTVYRANGCAMAPGADPVTGRFKGRPAALESIARFDRHATHSDIPLLVDFWAIWCGPCRAMAPIFEQAATQLEPDFRLVKVDSDAVQELLRRFSIQSIPTLMLLHRAREV